MMGTKEKIALAKDVLGVSDVVVLKKDKGLIERCEFPKTIITEDNKELLMG